MLKKMRGSLSKDVAGVTKTSLRRVGPKTQKRVLRYLDQIESLIRFIRKSFSAPDHHKPIPAESELEKRVETPLVVSRQQAMKAKRKSAARHETSRRTQATRGH